MEHQENADRQDDENHHTRQHFAPQRSPRRFVVFRFVFHWSAKKSLVQSAVVGAPGREALLLYI